MIDLHCHLLSGIDDGPKTMEESLRMAQYAIDQGINHSVLTPHINPGSYDNNAENITAKFIAFKSALAEQNIPLSISMAAEVRVCAELPQMINQNQIPFLGVWQGKKVLLLEFPHDRIPLGTDKLIKWLLDKDIIPLIAHPERNQAVIKHFSSIMPFVRMGCLIQVTAHSITGLFGNESQECALRLIKQGCVTAIATDAHNLHKRAPSMQPAFDYLVKIIGEQKANILVCANPRILIENC